MNSNGTKETLAIADGFRRACGYFPSGVAIVAGCDPEEGPFGFSVSTFSPVSYEPALISICISENAASLARLRRSKRFSVGILREDQEKSARHFGTPGSIRFPDDVSVTARLFCEAAEFFAAGDHCIVIAAVQRVLVHGGNPLVYWKRAFFRLHLEYPFVATSTALEEFVRDWEAGVLPHGAWTHAAHIAVTAYHAFDRGADELFAAMKRGIVHFNTCVGTVNGPDRGYHETLTRLWSNVIAGFTWEHNFPSRLEAAREAVAVFGEDRDLHRMYYSFDVVRDHRARQEWIPPDREPPAAWRAGRINL